MLRNMLFISLNSIWHVVSVIILTLFLYQGYKFFERGLYQENLLEASAEKSLPIWNWENICYDFILHPQVTH